MEKGGKRSLRLLGAIAVALAGIGAFVWLGESEPKNAYGFQEAVYEYGELRHEIYYRTEVDTSLLRDFGDALAEAGYFGEQYGGIARLVTEGEAYRVDLAYPERLWGDEAFLEDMRVLAEDLRTFALERPVRLYLVDVDEEGVYEKRVEE